MLKETKRELDDIKTVLTMSSPFLSLLLRRSRIIADPTIKTAGVNKKGEIRINLEFLSGLNTKTKAFVYNHEVLHIAFRHAWRGEGKNDQIFKIAIDCPVNTILQAHGLADGVQFPFDIVTPKFIASQIGRQEEEIAKMTVEELYYLLEKNPQIPKKFKVMNDVSRDSSETEKKPGDQKDSVIQEGDPEAYKPDKNPQEAEDYWKKAVVQAAVIARSAGKLPGELERIINDLLKAKVNWKKVIKKEILNGIGKSIISTWQRPARKHSLLPGIKRLTIPNVWCLIDTSGSISEEELAQFLGEVYGISKNQGKVVIIPWDAMVYPAIELSKPRDIARAIKEMKGGGGTIIAPALEKLMDSIRFGDVTVILTDGYIFDLERKETQKLLRGAANKSSVAVFATIATTSNLPSKWRQIRIEI